MKPYSRESICIKCACTDASAKYLGNSKKNEAIHRICHNCGYSWDEEPLNIHYNERLESREYTIYNSPSKTATIRHVGNVFRLIINDNGLKSYIDLEYKDMRRLADELALFCEIHDRRTEERYPEPPINYMEAYQRVAIKDKK